MTRFWPKRCAILASAAAWLAPTVVAAQTSSSCAFVCLPELKIEPTFTIEPLGRRPRVEVDGEAERVARETFFELIFALEVPTEIPRVGFTLEAIVLPFGATSFNPSTGVSADIAGHEFRDNGIEIEVELNFDLIDEARTGGWLSSHVDLVDKFSPAATPGARSVYTHKLNFELDTAFHVFNWLPADRWLRHVEAEVSLDYVATGLPTTGDVLGDERFLAAANPWSISFVMVLPLVPPLP